MSRIARWLSVLLCASNVAFASKWTGPRFVVVKAKIEEISKLGERGAHTIGDVVWQFDDAPDLVVVKARKTEVLEAISDWNVIPYLKNLESGIYVAVPRASAKPGAQIEILLTPKPIYWKN